MSNLAILPDWTQISLLEQVFWVVTIPATVVFLILLALTIFGGDADTGVDVDTDVDSGLADGDSIPFQFISLKNIVAFFAVFGWSGIGFVNAGLAPWLVILLAVICGLLMMLLMATLFYLMSRLAESGTLKMKNAIGKLGEVYLVIPANHGGMGKVQLNVQGSLRTLDAITDDMENIPTSSIIQVVDVIDEQILLVKKQGK
jgi:membrane protein implicated in regulation of membrane protease activity